MSVLSLTAEITVWVSRERFSLVLPGRTVRLPPTETAEAAEEIVRHHEELRAGAP